jgi:hypothetical protein
MSHRLTLHLMSRRDCLLQIDSRFRRKHNPIDARCTFEADPTFPNIVQNSGWIAFVRGAVSAAAAAD